MERPNGIKPEIHFIVRVSSKMALGVEPGSIAGGPPRLALFGMPLGAAFLVLRLFFPWSFRQKNGPRGRHSLISIASAPGCTLPIQATACDGSVAVARVSTAVRSQIRASPLSNGIRVTPSGLLPSLLHMPGGFRALRSARLKVSLICEWRDDLPAVLEQDRPCDASAVTGLPQMHV